MDIDEILSAFQAASKSAKMDIDEMLSALRAASKSAKIMHTPKTNEDRIRSMTVEELAELLFQRGNGQEYCYGICVRQDECESGPDDRRICIDNIVKWLKSPCDNRRRGE